MKELNGLAVLRRIKSDDQLRTIPVVILTSSKEERDVVAAYKLGANAYVVKMADFRDLVAELKLAATFWAVVNRLPKSAR